MNQLTFGRFAKVLLRDIWLFVSDKKVRQALPMSLAFVLTIAFASNAFGFSTHPYWWGMSMFGLMAWAKF